MKCVIFSFFHGQNKYKSREFLYGPHYKSGKTFNFGFKMYVLFWVKIG